MLLLIYDVIPRLPVAPVGMTHVQPDPSYELSLNSRNPNAYIKAV